MFSDIQEFVLLMLKFGLTKFLKHEASRLDVLVKIDKNFVCFCLKNHHVSMNLCFYESGEGIVALYAAPNPSLLNKICLNQCFSRQKKLFSNLLKRC